VTKQSPIELLTRFVGQSGLPRLANGFSRGGVGTQVVEDVQQVFLAPFIGTAVALDHASAEGDFIGHWPVQSGSGNDGGQPFLDQDLFLLITQTATAHALEGSQQAQGEETAEAAGLQMQRERQRGLPRPQPRLVPSQQTARQSRRQNAG